MKGARLHPHTCIFILALCTGLVPLEWAQAAIIVQVDTTEDIVDPDDEIISLREAFDQVNASDEEGNILLQLGKEYRLSLCAPSDDDANRNGDLDHLSNGTLTISGNEATIRQTCPGARVIDQFGTGLLNLNDVTIMGGDAATEPGGGVFVRGLGDLDVKNSNIYGNKSAGAGGGIASQGNIRLTGSNVAMNFAREVGAGVASFTSLILINSSVTGNTVGEQSPIGIGGIVAENQIVLIYSTVQDNTAPNLDVRGGPLRSFGSVVAAPRGGGPACGNIGKGTESWGYNFTDDDSCGFGAGMGDQVNTAGPMLGPRQGHGIVPLVYPLEGSPLIDAIPRGDCIPTTIPAELIPPWVNLEADMTGAARPQLKGCDIGATERVAEEALTVTGGRADTTPVTVPAGKSPEQQTVVDTTGNVPVWLAAVLALVAMILGVIIGHITAKSFRR